ncbi:uncharacterized protein ACB058_016558 [Synchiropus picturatus]
MLKSILVCGLLGALLIPAECDLITVCVEDDGDLRVDCLVGSKSSQITSYEFSWSLGSKEHLINTNVSGSSAEATFADKSYVTELEPHGFRLTLQGFTDSLPHNTTYMCKNTGKLATVNVERDQLLQCSAVSWFTQSAFFWVASQIFLLNQL